MSDEGELKKRIYKVVTAPKSNLRVTDNKSKHIKAMIVQDYSIIDQIIDDAKKDFYNIIIGDSFENPSPEVLKIRQKFCDMEIIPKIKYWFGDSS